MNIEILGTIASITGAFSVGLINSFGVIFNIYHLIKIYKKEESYD